MVARELTTKRGAKCSRSFSWIARLHSHAGRNIDLLAFLFPSIAFAAIELLSRSFPGQSTSRLDGVFFGFHRSFYDLNDVYSVLWCVLFAMVHDNGFVMAERGVDLYIHDQTFNFLCSSCSVMTAEVAGDLARSRSMSIL